MVKLFFIIITKKFENNVDEIKSILKNVSVDASLEEEYQIIKEICLKCIQKEPELRPYIIDVLNHLFQSSFKKIEGKKVN